MTQVITNLRTNAAKYTQDGHVLHLRTRIDRQYLAIFVRESGIWLAPEARGNVFEMFARIDSDVGRSVPGWVRMCGCCTNSLPATAPI